MNMIFFEEAASDSGNVGFSEAWPLHDGQCPDFSEGSDALTIQPTLHAHSSVLQCLLSIQRWHSCCCLCLLEPIPHTISPLARQDELSKHSGQCFGLSDDPLTSTY